MKQAKRWVCGLLAGILALLGLSAAAVYWIDPCLYYRMPDQWDAVFFNERYQAAGLARNVPADTVLVGSSMAANYRASDITEAFDSPAVRITIPDGFFQEFDQVMDVLFRSRPRERILFALDANILLRDDSGVTDAMPKYLYDNNPFNDATYLLNKDTLYYSAYVLAANGWGQGQSLDEGFTWDQGIWWNHRAALEEYQRPEIEPKTLAPDALLPVAKENLAVVEQWITEHPETEFRIFLSPYSILYWDKNDRQGRTEAVFTALEYSCKELLSHENVRLYGYLFDREIVENLDHYCDYVHHSGDVSREILQKMAADEGRLTKENYQETLANWREFVINYDYEKFWDDGFWAAWNQQHGAPETKPEPA